MQGQAAQNNYQAMTTKTINIFRAGQHTAMNGQSIKFTEYDIRRVAAAYNPRLHVAPLVLGHPAVDAPAYGAVQSLRADGANLFAEAAVGDTLAEKVRKGEYLRVSSSFYSPASANNPMPGSWYLRHVGFLGAMPPAVKGLEPPDFADAEGCVSFVELFTPPTFAAHVEGVDFGGHPDAFHKAARSLMAHHPGMSYGEAAGAVHRRFQDRQAIKGMPVAPDREEAHWAILKLQGRNPGMSYTVAASLVLGG